MKVALGTLQISLSPGGEERGEGRNPRPTMHRFHAPRVAHSHDLKPRNLRFYTKIPTRYVAAEPEKRPLFPIPEAERPAAGPQVQQGKLGELMPSISMFYGLIVYLYFKDNRQHKLPHIQVKYQDEEVIMSIPDGTVLQGGIPNPKMKLLQA